jgi:hypothetical protein
MKSLIYSFLLLSIIIVGVVNTQQEGIPPIPVDIELPPPSQPPVINNKPRCSWMCDDPICDAICTPICKPLDCHIVVLNPNNDDLSSFNVNNTRCQIQCADPIYDNINIKSSCPQCQPLCERPICPSGGYECETVCKYTECNWNCIKPNCPKPTCELMCEIVACINEDNNVIDVTTTTTTILLNAENPLDPLSTSTIQTTDNTVDVVIEEEDDDCCPCKKNRRHHNNASSSLLSKNNNFIILFVIIIYILF